MPETPYQKTHIVDSDGNILDSLGSGGTGGGTADFTQTNARLGATTEPAATTITAPSGLNGLLRFFIGKFTTTAAGLKTDGSAVTQPISAAALPLPSGAAANETLTSVRDRLPLQLTPGGSLKTDSSATTQPISGSVNVGNFPATQPIFGNVTVGNFPATQPISAAALPLPTDAATDATLAEISDRIGAIDEPAAASPTAPASLGGLLRRFFSLLPATLSIDNRLKVESTFRKLTSADDKVGATIEASVLPDGAATDLMLAQIRDRTNDTILTGSISGVGQEPLAIYLGASQSNWLVQVTGTFVGQIVTELSGNGSDFVPVAWRQSQTGSLGNTIRGPGLYRGSLGGGNAFRVRATSWTSGTANITIRSSAGVGAVFLNTMIESRTLESYYASKAGGNVLFNTTSGVVTSTNAVTTLILYNPPASTTDVYITRQTLSASGAGRFERMRNAAVTIAGSPLSSQNRGGGTNTAMGTAYLSPSGATATGGGQTAVTFVAASQPLAIEEHGSLVLKPGQSLTWVYTPSGAGSFSSSVNVIWYESLATI